MHPYIKKITYSIIPLSITIVGAPGAYACCDFTAIPENFNWSMLFSEVITISLLALLAFLDIRYVSKLKSFEILARQFAACGLPYIFINGLVYALFYQSDFPDNFTRAYIASVFRTLDGVMIEAILLIDLLLICSFLLSRRKSNAFIILGFASLVLILKVLNSLFLC